MNLVSLTKYSTLSFLKGILVASITLLGAFVGYISVLLLGLYTPNTPTFLEDFMSTFYFLLITAVIAALIGELFLMLKQRFIERFLSIFIYHFFFYFIIRIGDAFFLNTKAGFSYEVISHIFPSFLFALVVALLWRPVGELTSVFNEASTYFKFRSNKNWFFRFFIAWICFVPIYYFTSWLLSPFIEPYYSEIGGEVLVVFNFYTTVIIKFVIGALLVAILMPIFILWKRSKTSLLFWVGFPIFMLAAVYSSLIQFWFPTGIRFPYLIQYTVICYLIAIIFVQLFYVPDENEIIDDHLKWMY
ncbi:hypothetical protein BKP35_01885 [Anaerobacillus arseniciselenatis]|uniref:Uncharacterized protein n=1 Tax=Anaerobacillus arseniciselenatis TaxID=85682 RepID=A0A1S2LWN6_9BACI|nr:hypothetical protein [Anaerobacillus arseniciselenatis]OIJ15765.1 hypothetical protein BKP35_01885 [Anaerobacillus arseniciselenatis]